ncbi:MAG: hypothetical protein AAB573_05250 [Patescibacteria group bacterium]
MTEQQSSIESRALEVVQRYKDHMRAKGVHHYGTSKDALKFDIASRIVMRQKEGINALTHNASTWYRDHAPAVVREGLDKIH